MLRNGREEELRQGDEGKHRIMKREKRGRCILLTVDGGREAGGGRELNG
jgi:hypothetical protein